MISRTQFTKRYRMERSLWEEIPSTPVAEFQLVPWDDRLIEHHAHVLFHGFADDYDSRVFPCLRSYDGCLNLMRSMRGLPGFCPAATWLIAGPRGYVGTVQGLMVEHRYAAVQNIGILPGFRGLGLGSALLAAALAGFKRSGATRAYLEVTASNQRAVCLYRKFGFRNYRLLYKSAPLPESAFAEARV